MSKLLQACVDELGEVKDDLIILVPKVLALRKRKTFLERTKKSLEKSGESLTTEAE